MDKALYPILIVQTILYLVAFISGLAASISIAVMNGATDGYCVFSVILDDSNYYYFNLELNAWCQFPMAMAICACIVIGLAMAALNIFKLCTQTDRWQILLLPEIVLNGIICLMLLVAACLVSVGFSRFCHSIEVSVNIQDFRCELLGLNGVAFDEGATVYRNLSVAQTSAWVNFLLWFQQIILCGVRLYRSRQGPTSTSKANNPGPIPSVI